ncbi:MAG: LysR family transcriptional regulator [Pseudomonadota bacterium]
MSARGLPPLSWLRAFEAAARHLSFTIAADELNLTQSAVSQHVRSLEDFLGHRLFVRQTRSLRLTEAGMNYLPTVREAFDVLARGTRSFTGTDPARRLNLHCNLSFSVHWLAPRLADLADRHPWLRLNITTSLWEPRSLTLERSVEIRFGRSGDMPDRAERLTQDQAYPVCAPFYQEGRFDLTTARLYDCAGMMSTWDLWARKSGQPFERTADITLASTYLVGMSTACAGGGMVMCHDTLAGDLLRQGALVQPFDGSITMTEAYFLIPPSIHDTSDASAAFITWLSEKLNHAHPEPAVS